MEILVIGGTGQIGSLLLAELARRGRRARVMIEKSKDSKLSDGFEAIDGDLLDPASILRALDGVTAVFLLVPVVPDETMRTLLALDVMREASVPHIVYQSQVTLDYLDNPHTAAKAAAEAMIVRAGLPATILRPAYFFQNDVAEREAILAGRYRPPIGHKGVSMVDARDIAEVAAIALTDRDLFGSDAIVDLVGPDALTGEAAAAIWSSALGREIRYQGDDWAAAGERAAEHLPPWGARDIALMFRNILASGMQGRPGAATRITELLGRAPRSYCDFAAEQAATWLGSSV